MIRKQLDQNDEYLVSDVDRATMEAPVPARVPRPTGGKIAVADDRAQ
jgi:hypothetical protein